MTNLREVETPDLLQVFRCDSPKQLQKILNSEARKSRMATQTFYSAQKDVWTVITVPVPEQPQPGSGILVPRPPNGR